MNFSEAIYHAVSICFLLRKRLHQRRHCWETPLSGMVKPLESRDACGSEFIPIEPCHHTHHINRSGNTKVLQMRFGKTDITGAAHTKGTNSLRNRRFDAFSEQIQWIWRGQRTQAVVENLILITSLVLLSMAGVQLILLCPWRQIACWRSQSMRNWLASMPCSVLACHFTSPRAGPITSIPYCCRLETRMGAVI